jgi:hypothetical protein
LPPRPYRIDVDRGNVLALAPTWPDASDPYGRRRRQREGSPKEEFVACCHARGNEKLIWSHDVERPAASEYGAPTTAIRTFPDELSMSPTPRLMRWEWLERVSQRSNLTSSSSWKGLFLDAAF